jgi:hypothetical protein
MSHIDRFVAEYLGKKPASAPDEGSNGQSRKPVPQGKDETARLEGRRRDLKKARAAWVAVKNKAEADLEKVKEGARMAYLADAKQFPKIAQGCKDIDDLLDHLDDELRDTLDQYLSTPLKNKPKLVGLAAQAAAVVDRYHQFVAANLLLKAVDQKEFADVTVHAPVLQALSNLRKALS